jgi:hypothetical protein
VSPRSLLIAGAIAVAAVAGLIALADGSRPPRLEGAASQPALAAQPRPGAPRLAWAPPALDDPQEVRVPDDVDTVHLDDGRDYVLRLPKHKRIGGLLVDGGRNVVLIGGRVTIPTSASTDQEHKALAFIEQTGTVHVEGVSIDGSAGGQGDGISISAPDATFQLENLRIAGLRGSESGIHADIVQPWGGARELRVDRLSGSSRYQGLQIPIDNGGIGRATLRNVDLQALPNASGSGGHMLWTILGEDCSAYPIRLRAVYVLPRAGRSFATSVWPEARRGRACAGRRRGGTIDWPQLPIDGAVRRGRPPHGAFVPPRAAGVGYRSPGYLSRRRSSSAR